MTTPAHQPGQPAARPLTLADLTAAYGGQWQIQTAEFCYIAIRRPTPTSQEILTARTPEQLAAKIDAEP
jgi:hypothetical protein